MTKEQQVLCDHMVEFFKENFDKIDYDLSDSNLPITKREFLGELRNDPETAAWALTELASWGMDKEYLRDVYVDTPSDCSFTVLKFGDVYMKFHILGYIIEPTEPKTKTVTYFE